MISARSPPLPARVAPCSVLVHRASQPPRPSLRAAPVAGWDDSDAGARPPPKPSLDRRPAGSHWAGFSALVLAPGVPLTHPEPHWTADGKAAGVEVIGDIELFGRERARNVRAPSSPSPAPTENRPPRRSSRTSSRKPAATPRWAAISVTAMLSLDPFAPGRHYVVECSSFQIDLAPTLEPAVGVLLERHARSPRPPRHHRQLRRRQGAARQGRGAVPSSASMMPTARTSRRSSSRPKAPRR